MMETDRSLLRAREKELLEAETAKNEAYHERNQVVAALTKLYPAGIKVDPRDEEWPVVLIDLPTGQVSWHFHASELDLVAHLGAYPGEWDGHDTGQKYARLASLAALLEPAPQPDGDDVWPNGQPRISVECPGCEAQLDLKQNREGKWAVRISQHWAESADALLALASVPEREPDADTRRLDELERMVRASGGLVLHINASAPHRQWPYFPGLALEPGTIRRSLREAIDGAAPTESEVQHG
jgi:hypothetical protein